MLSPNSNGRHCHKLDRRVSININTFCRVNRVFAFERQNATHTTPTTCNSMPATAEIQNAKSRLFSRLALRPEFTRRGGFPAISQAILLLAQFHAGVA
jgi:hypothetical protein